MLSPSRIHPGGQTEHPHEREALDFIESALPDHDPFQVWPLIELLDAGTGRLLEIDALILGFSALYLVEIKSGPGRYEGDSVDWWRIPPGDRARWMEPPLRLTNYKAKVLKSGLVRRMRDSRSAPFVQPLVFLSHEDVDIQPLKPEGKVAVVTRSTLLKAVQHHEFPGQMERDRPRRRIDRKVARDVQQALSTLGLRPRQGRMFAGSYQLGPVLAEGAGYQDRSAVHRDNERSRARARIYLVPQQSSVERRQQLVRAAERESNLLYDVREHKGVLTWRDFVGSAELGPTVIVDDLEEGLPLDAFLRKHEDLDFHHRITIIESVGRALAHCHEKNVIHGGLSPEAVLVRSTSDGSFDTRLMNFQLGHGVDVTATVHWTALAAEPWAVYQAPELREGDPTRTRESDLFSLGALAYLVMTGRSPGDNVADVGARLKRDGHLDPSAVSDTLPDGVAEAVRGATSRLAMNRYDDVTEWLEILLAEATDPNAGVEETNPLEAMKGESLDGDLTITKVLGFGASSRVLQVRRESDDREYALKVASEDHDERLEHEAKALESLRHVRIVKLVETRQIGGHRALLLSLAGDATLERELAKEGAVSLDYAQRYGKDLLSALEHLEEMGVLHRDIKPANLGVGSAGKGENHLTLFDFSLAATPVTELLVGTSPYRDPQLVERGQWDAAADRWAAAITLHEMLTGVRPDVEDGRAHIAAEQFEATVREPLSAFFLEALADQANERYETADAMRRAWMACFDAPSVATAEAKGGTEPPPEGGDSVEYDDARLREIGPDALLDTLPLSLRAKNGLDRAGVVTASDLLGLPANRLSAIRGVGKRIANEIWSFRQRWQALHEDAAAGEPFYPDYRGDNVAVATIANIDRALVQALRDGGLLTVGAVAKASRGQIASLCKRTKADSSALTAMLDAEQRATDERKQPTTLEGWIEALLPSGRRAKSKRVEHLRKLFGLDAPFAGKLDVRVGDVAKTLQHTPANLYIALGQQRSEWETHGALSELRTQLMDLVRKRGGAVPLSVAAEDLLAVMTHERTAAEETRLVRAATLFRVVAEVDKGAERGLRQTWLRGEVPWLVLDASIATALPELGQVADDLATRDVLASPSEAGRQLAEAAKGTPLAGLASEALVQLAAKASQSSVLSARMELYPRKMPATRALALSASVLGTQMTEADVRTRVGARYPEADALPPRPELDALLAGHGLRFDEEAGRYDRLGAQPGSTLSTKSVVSTQHHSGFGTQEVDPRQASADAFEDRLRNSIERQQLRVLSVNAEHAHRTTLALAKYLKVTPVQLDAELLSEMRQIMKARNIDEQAVRTADAEGPAGPAWGNLQKLMELAAESLASRLFPPSGPVLLIQPGLIARHRLLQFLKVMVDASQDDAAAAILMLVPGHDTGGMPTINGQLAIPGVLPPQALTVSRRWVELQLKGQAA